MLRFAAADTSNYTALLLGSDGRSLYVGARETLFALDSSVSFQPGGHYQEVSGGRAAGGGGTPGQREA